MAAAGLLFCALISMRPGGAQSADEPEWIPQPVAKLQGLDKVTARISTVTVPVGETVVFGTLQITAQTCQEHPPTLAPESAAFLVIEDQPPDETPRRVFDGWMFASSPALNSLDHPVYDVWMLACSSDSTAGQSPSAGKN
jgi:hypothetical protein